MSSTTLTTTDILPSSVPKLLPTGLNWTAFSIRFKEAIEAKGFWGHFNGTSPKPTISSPPEKGEADALEQWLKDEQSAKALLTHHIPDSTLIRIHSKESLSDRWSLIVKEYTQKGTFAHALWTPSVLTKAMFVNSWMTYVLKRKNWPLTELLSKTKTTNLQL